MTAENIIKSADKIRPNLINEATKLDWLYTIENKVAEHMTRYSQSEADTNELVLQSQMLLPLEYKDIYTYYIVCMIDLTNQDIAMYNNSCAYFNEMFTSWQKKWRREHLPQKTPAKSGDN